MTTLPAWIPWEGAAVRRSLLLALAATLSFLAATLLHVQNPYWAAMPVWVISQPARGVLVERALFRILGTLAGAAFGFALMHAPVSPFLRILILALWIALNAGTTHLLRGVHGYGALLAGITAVVVVIPSLVNPSASMGLAVARVNCTLIGVIIASLVMAFQTPESPLASFYDEVRGVSAEAVIHALGILRGEGTEDGKEEGRILGHISRLDDSGRLHAAGSVEGYRRLGDVDLLVLASLSTLAAARAARDAGCHLEGPLRESLEAVAEHLNTAWSRPFPPGEAPLPSPEDPALARLFAAVGDILAADRALCDTDARRAYTPLARPADLAPPREWPLAGREGLMAGAAALGALALAQAFPTPTMGLAAMGVCVFVMVLGSMPLPQLMAPKLISGVVLGVLAAFFYRLVLQPVVTAPLAMVLSLLPFMLAGGFFRTHPRFGVAGVDFNMCFLLASQVGKPATHDVAGILLDGGALMASAGLMATLFILLPPRSRRQAADAATLIRRDLQRILEPDGTLEPPQWGLRGSRRILRLALHLGRAKGLSRKRPLGLLAVLNLGQAMVELRVAGMAEAIRAPLAATLQHRMHPRDAARLLRDQGGPEPVLRLADYLEQAEDILLYPSRSSCRKGRAWGPA